MADYCINPYVGCGHGCKYCYAESYTRRFTRHKELWGQFVDVKVNALQVLEKAIPRHPKGRVFLSSLTDAYQPLESKYGITREILKILLDYQFPISIQTKSSLVLRDLDLLSKFDSCEVGFTITSLDESVRKIFEPHSSPASERLDAIKKLKKKGIITYVFFGPILPLLSDRNLEEYFQTLAELKVDYVYVDKLNLKPGLWNVLEETVKMKYPQLVSEWQTVLRSKNDYYVRVRSIIQDICLEKKLECEMCF
ncbi:MAG: radical SAM protein [Candidatus Bathyarchaeota archaeon]|nr:radical SAM protein [Candidatus Bathyarchaeota archaeon]